jgi:hypothetical protein
MGNDTKSRINITEDIILAPVSKQRRKDHLSQILRANCPKNMTMKEKKKEALKPIYLVRYE